MKGKTDLEYKKGTIRLNWTNFTFTVIPKGEKKMVKIFKNGDEITIVTDEQNEDNFINAMAAKLSKFIDTGVWEGDWEFQFGYLLSNVVELCQFYRGDKNSVLLVASSHGTVPSAVCREVVEWKK